MIKKCLASGFSILILFFLGSGCGFDPSYLLREQTMDPLPPAIANRTIPQNSRAKLAWRKGQISIRRQLFPSPGLVVGHGYVAYVNFLGGPLSMINQMDILEATSGATLWQSAPFATHEDIAISKDRAFVLLDRGRSLNIYHIKGDKKPLQSFDQLNEPTKFYLFPPVVEKDIYIYYIKGNEFSLHRLDLTGNEMATLPGIPANNAVSDLFLFGQPFFLLTGKEYIGGNFETHEELWRIPARGRVDSWPILQYDTLIISSGDGLKYSLMAVDIENGRKLWETEKVFGSNVILHKDSLYVLRNDAALVKLNLTTGQVEGEIPFEPASANFGEWAYLLASDGQKLFVYFGDSQELFALETPD
jgi:outer membrane protein assembly factor BamB